MRVEVINMSYQTAGYGSNVHYEPPSQLEHIASYSPLSGDIMHYSAAAVEAPAVFYRGIDAQIDLYGKAEDILYAVSAVHPIEKEYAFVPDHFLKPNRAPQRFVGDAKEVEEAVKEAFAAVTNEAFPVDVRIAVLEHTAFQQQVDNPGVVGFSINRKEHGLISDVVVRAGEKDHVLLTIGHEIGHVLSRPLNNKQSEEAKAFAFSAAWMNAIKKHNIAGLRNAIILENPAQNGLHDVACDFVWRMLRAGKDALELYWELVRGAA